MPDSKVRHVQQNYDWDCGLACAAMIIDALGYDCTLEDLYDLYPQKSIWTIDLAYLLRNFVPKDLTFYTSYPGAHKEHRTAGFYRDQFEQDEKRVNHLFAHAEENGVDVVNMIYPLDDFKRLFLGSSCDCQFAAIVLVNANLLDCQRPHCIEYNSHESRKDEEFDVEYLVPKDPEDVEYVGHYITLVGYRSRSHLFVYRNPAVHQDYCLISPEQLDIARRVKGTDHDCIVVRI